MGACVLCKEQITNPLSPERIEEQIASWLIDSQPELVNSFFETSKEIIENNVKNEDFCIVTGKKMNVCTYCYTEHILKWLLTTKPDWKTIKEYFKYFDYDAEKLGYTRDIQALGYML